MRIFLDNCVDHRAKRLFPGHDVAHARDRGWENLGNGELLTAVAQAGFDTMITVDKNIRYQQNLSRLPVPVVEINAPDVRFPALQKLAPQINSALVNVERFLFVSIDREGRVETLAARTPEQGNAPDGPSTKHRQQPGREPDFER